MTSKPGGISGVSVAVMTAGAMLVYAGMRGVSPLDVLRSLSKGNLPGVPNRPGPSTTATQSAYLTSTGAGAHPEFVAAAERYAGDQYSQLSRNSAGYSDCSSFVCKAMRDCGVPDAFPLGWPRTTITLKSWSSMVQIPTAQAGAGDLAISDTDGSSAHVIMITGAGTAIGQQNTRENVRTGPIDQLMDVPYHVYRYVGSGHPATATGGGSLPNIAAV